ncbi:MAG: type II toxin-antitoxin system ParD family antitoxin [Acidobacteria bacterium]|nr:type II toxin-antitoxin system ParD family antitoxin [Acidobacteriota bacterium]
MTIKSPVSLSDEQHAFVRALVETGRYASVSAVLQLGLDLLRRRLENDELERMALREVLARRCEGEFVTAKGMDRRLAELIGARRRSQGLSA